MSMSKMKLGGALRAAVLALSVLGASAGDAQAAIPASQRNALIAIYNATNGANWGMQNGWLGAPGTECTWYGVACDGTQSNVVTLNLGGNNLVGVLPPEIGDFPALGSLFLWGNSLSGAIPSQIGNLTALRNLDLSVNSLSGPIPPQLGSLTLLQSLFMDGNQLTGTIPVQLGNLPGLVYLWIYQNNLSGPIPPQLGNLASLRELDLGANSLSGTIPTSLGAMPALQQLRLGQNSLSGTIPTELGNLPSLRTLELGGNSLSGTIPPSLGTLALLEWLDLSGNSLTGAIPPQLGSCTNLTDLALNDNALTGSIPTTFGGLTLLQRLILYSNNLSGPIPVEIGQMTALQEILISNNLLSGPIPAEIGQLSALRTLDAYVNQLSGAIPVEMGNLASLEALALNDNVLTGSIPVELGQLANLQFLSLANNNLTGFIPTQLGGLTNLRSLYLEANQLDGSIPTTFTGTTTPALQYFSVGNNNLTGFIPTQLGGLTNLRELHCNDNNLTGFIPTQLGGLTNLQVLNLSFNQLGGTIPTSLGGLSNLQVLNLGVNSLTGFIPTQLGGLTNLRQLDLGNNDLTGTIPREIGNLTLLEWLFVDDSLFGGAIPPELGNLTRLQRLYPVSNVLVGDLPATLMNLTQLQPGELDLRWNAVYTTSAALRTFLNTYQAGNDWESTQTIAATNVAVTGATQTSLSLSWTPILYQADLGGYDLMYATTSGGSYTTSGRTPTKSSSTGTIPGLQPARRYYVVLQTVTEPHGANRNFVRSELSVEVSAMTASCFGISPAVLPGGFVGDAYNQILTTTGGTAPFTWSVASGTLPTGLTLSAGGTLSGTLAAPGTFAFNIRAQDAAACAGSMDYVVTIRREGNHVVGQGLGQPNANRVRVFAGNGTASAVDFLAYGAGRWGVNVSGADVDGTETEILTGPGPGDVFGPQVRGFRRDGAPMGKVNFYAYGTLKYGVNVGGGRTDADVYEEIVSGAGPGAVFGPHVRGWNVDGGTVAAIGKVNYFAYGTLKFGVNVATGQVDGDAYAEVLTGPGPGAIFGPQVRGWNVDGGAVTSIAKINFNAFTPAQFGANVEAGDVEGDLYAEIVAAPGPGAGASFPSQFRGFDFDASTIASKAGYDVVAFPTAYGGRPGVGDVTRDARAELLAGAGRDPAADSSVKRYDYQGAVLVLLPGTFVPFGTATYGVNVAGADLGY